MSATGPERARDRPADSFVHRTSPSSPAPVALSGLLGDSDRDGRRRLYLNTRLDYYVEFRTDDVVGVDDIPPQQAPFAGLDATRVHLAPGASLDWVRSSPPVQPSALFLEAGQDQRVQAAEQEPTATWQANCPQVTHHFGDSDFVCGGGGGGGGGGGAGSPSAGGTCGTTFGTWPTQGVHTCATCARDTCRTCDGGTCVTCAGATCATCNGDTCATCVGDTCATCGTCGEATCVTCGGGDCPTQWTCADTCASCVSCDGTCEVSCAGTCNVSCGGTCDTCVGTCQATCETCGTCWDTCAGCQTGPAWCMVQA